jgi:hypothetical protein
LNPRDLIADLETVPDAPIDAGAPAEPVDTAATDTPAADAAPVDAAPEIDPTEPLYSRIQQLEEFSQQLAQLAPLLELVPYLQQQQQGGQQAPQQVDWSNIDQFDENFVPTLGQHLEQRDQRLIQEIQQIRQLFNQALVEPMQQWQQQQTAASLDQHINDLVAKDVTRNGEFHPDPTVDREIRDEVRDRFWQMLNNVAQPYGGIDRVDPQMAEKIAELAMSQAAQQTRDKYRRAIAAAIQTEDNRRAGLAGVRSEPGMTAGSVAGTPAFDGMGSVGDFYAARARTLSQS